MKSPQKYTICELEGYGEVIVWTGPSPENPYIEFKVGHRTTETLHIDEWNERRIR